MINTLHIHGSFYGKAPQHLYTYGEGAQKTTWQNYIWDTRPYTANIPQCYALWSIVKHILAGDATYGAVSDSAYELFPASQIGLHFCRRIYVVCHDEKGKVVNDARVFCNGKKLEQDMETLKLYHDCPENATSVKLRVLHENYETFDKNYEIRENRQQIIIPLVLKGYNVVLKIDEATLKAERVKVGSLEYCSLMKHGARISGDSIFLNVVRG